MIFNIQGNDYRLIARVQYQAGVLEIRFLERTPNTIKIDVERIWMDATLILIDDDAEVVRARALVDRLWDSKDPGDIARMQAQARLIAAYEQTLKPPRVSGTADLIRHLIDQHELSRADMVPILGTPSRVSEVLAGKKELSLAMIQRLRARFRIPADLLIPPPKQAKRATKRASA